MRRRLDPYFTTLMLILMLTLSLTYAPIAVSQDSAEIIPALEELLDDVSELPDEAFENTNAVKGQRAALMNKIGAVIHQIEARADEGAINKLKNDLKNTIMAWVTDEYEGPLIEKIDEIISLIEDEFPPQPQDTTPPNIVSVLRVPETPNYDEDVTVIAQVVDEKSGVFRVILMYSTNTGDEDNIVMNLRGGLYVAEIPAKPYNTNVSYKVSASDKAGNLAVSRSYSYVVIDSYAPVISWVERSPISPNYNDTVLVSVSVSEPEEASGVQLAILSYSDGDTWTNLTMTLEEETIYEGSIPELNYGTTVEYMVYASDNAENWAVSNIYSYIVGDEYPPTARIDKPAQGSCVKGLVEVTIFVYDDNFEKAELSINGTIVESWTSTGVHTYNWNTTAYIDGVYVLNLTAYDEAGNIAEKVITVSVDQTLPSASINAPVEGSFLKGLVIISVTGADDNFEKMQLFINTTLVLTLNASGTYTHAWNTSNYNDGVYIITLKVYDKSDNMVTVEIAVTVDNTPPVADVKQPLEYAYLKGAFNIFVYGDDINFQQMKLYIDDDIVETWIVSGEQTYVWDTTELFDGVHTIKLIVFDKAGNFAEKQLSVTVDNTGPTARINAPAEGAFLKGLVILNVTGADDNMEKMQLYIDATLVLTLNASGTYTHAWYTSSYIDGVYSITLKVFDKANLTATVEITVTVDNTSPTAEIKQPSKDAYIKGAFNITVYGNDTNLLQMELYIGNNLTETWTASGEQTYIWETSVLLDGYYTIKLIVSDKAGNLAEKAFSVTVDNTLPTAIVDAPAGGAFLKGTVVIDVTGEDVNFEKMELKINDALVKSWTAGGSQIYLWNTEADAIDGAYTIKLIVYDKAGNSDENAVTLIVDNTQPTIRIDEPVEGSYLAGTVDIKVFIQEDNLDKAELTINGTGVVSWTLSGERIFNWDAIAYAEGIYFIKLSAMDKAGNIDEKTIEVTVDNTAPTALVHAPIERSYLKDTVFINVTGDDANFDRMELRIGDVLAKTWTTSGDKLFSWNTRAYSDGAYKVTLTVYDKADSSKEVFVAVTVDNTSPIIEAAEWTPKEPSTDEQVNVTVKVSDPQPGSEIQNVTLWYRNITTIDGWQPVPMSLNVTSGNWTATIPAQSLETTIKFKIEAFDNAGNKAESDENEYKVIAPAGIPLAWIVAIILLILAATIAAVYFWRKRRREKQGISSSSVENYKLTILLCF